MKNKNVHVYIYRVINLFVTFDPMNIPLRELTWKVLRYW